MSQYSTHNNQSRGAGNTSRGQQSYRRREGETFDMQQTQQALKEIYAGRIKWGVILAIICIPLSGIVFLLTFEHVWVWSVLGGAFVIFINGFSKKLNYSQYYCLPGSQFSNGDHRCIQCGHRGRNGGGIYRHKEYKGDTTYCDCSRCGERLYTE